MNGGATWSSWYNQPTAQFYHVITDDRFPYWVYGGQQESGSVGIASRSDYGEITFRDWHPVGVEEYGYVAPDPLDANIIYGGKVNRFNQATGENQDVSPVVLRTGKYRFNRTAPLIFAHADPHTLYLGANVLFKTSNGGQSWQIISPDLTRDDPGVPTNLGQYAAWSDLAKGKHRGVIYAIGPSFHDVNTIWIGTDDGQIQITRDGGNTWQNITPPAVTPWSKVAQIEASHFDDNTAFAAINRLRVDDLHAYVYRTHDEGKSWQKITVGLPDTAPVNTVREDPVRKGLLYAGTESGVWYSDDDGDHWHALQFNLPRTSVRDLVVHENDLIVGTHGRSFWILDDITPLRQTKDEVLRANAHLFEPEEAWRVRRNQNTDTPLPPEVPAGQNPPDGAILNYSLGARPSWPVMIVISDAQGKLVRRYSSADTPAVPQPKDLAVPYYWIRRAHAPSAAPGMHRMVWDLRYPPPKSALRDYPISAIVHNTPRYPLGALVTPGVYNVKLTVDGASQTQKLTVKMDPHVKITAPELQALFDAQSQVSNEMDRNFDALGRVRGLREQIKALLPNAQGDFAKSLQSFDTELASLAGSGGGFFAPASLDSLSALSMSLAVVYNGLDSADAQPTQQQMQTVRALQQHSGAVMGKWESIRQNDLPKLNAQLKAAGLPELDAERPSVSPESAGAGDEP